MSLCSVVCFTHNGLCLMYSRSPLVYSFCLDSCSVSNKFHWQLVWVKGIILLQQYNWCPEGQAGMWGELSYSVSRLHSFFVCLLAPLACFSAVFLHCFAPSKSRFGLHNSQNACQPTSWSVAVGLERIAFTWCLSYSSSVALETLESSWASVG